MQCGKQLLIMRKEYQLERKRWQQSLGFIFQHIEEMEKLALVLIIIGVEYIIKYHRKRELLSFHLR